MKPLFGSIRGSLFAVLASFALIGMLAVGYSRFYELQQSQLEEQLSWMDQLREIMLADQLAQRDFVRKAPTDPAFFVIGEHPDWTRHRHLHQKMVTIWEQLLATAWITELVEEKGFSPDSIRNQLLRRKQLAQDFADSLRQRGFKDYGIVGTMRDHVHWLEHADHLSMVDIFSLRQIEKDYLIRHDSSYCTRFESKVQQLLTDPRFEDDPVARHHLIQYAENFRRVVALDSHLGIHYDQGLLPDWHHWSDQMERDRQQLQVALEAKKEVRSRWLWLGYLTISAIAFLAILLVSWRVSGVFTRPLRVLSAQMRVLLESDFQQFPKALPAYRRQDEVQTLIQGYGQLTQTLQTHIQALERESAAAREASQAKSRFLANMSHEIRTPMNGIIGMADMLDVEGLTSDQRESIQIIRKSGESLLAIINDILDFSKIESGKIELEDQPFHLPNCIDDVLELLGPKAREKRLDLVASIAQDVPPWFKGDGMRLRQVLINLVSNSIKFTERGEVAILVQGYERNGQQAQIEFAVRDTGIGISKEKAKNIFEAFHQADASTTRKYGGTGLGLAISRHLTQLMGGDLWLESELGKGTTFYFRIQAPVIQQAPTTPRQTNDRSYHALVVDDNTLNREMICFQLHKLGLQTEAVSGGAEALKKLQVQAFDLLVYDLLMPGMSGLELAQATKAYSDSPIVMISSDQSVAASDTAEWVQAYAYKPLRAEQLGRLVSQILDLDLTHVQAAEEGPIELAEHFPLNILLVEDNPINQKIAVKMFHRLGYDPRIAENGSQALEWVVREPECFDLIFMDMQMPVMDGLTTTRRIKEQLGQYAPPIIAITANAMRGDKELCLEAGMIDYLSKPLKIRDLQDMLIKWGRPRKHVPQAEGSQTKD